MNSNGSQFLLLHDGEDFHTATGAHCLWDEQLQVLRLAGAQTGRFAWRPLPNALAAWLKARAIVLDPQGQKGFISEDHSRLLYSHTWPLDPLTARAVTASNPAQFTDTLEDLALQQVQAPENTAFTDLHLGGDGRAALSFSDDDTRHGIQLVHLARRWQSRCALLQPALRLWVDHLDRVWAAGHGWLGLCTGEPLPQDYPADKVRRFEPLHENPHPLRQQWEQALPVSGSLLAMCADEDQLYLLLWRRQESSSGYEQLLLSRSLDEAADAPFHIHTLPKKLPFATDIGCLGPRRLALMIPSNAKKPDNLDLPVIDLPQGDGKPVVLAERYPQHSQAQARFIAGFDRAVRYPSRVAPKQLHRLPQARYRQQGSATLSRMLDCGTPDTLWHKIYLEACIPPGCKLHVSVKAFDDIGDSGSDWQTQQAPLWLSNESELPFHRGHFMPKQGTQGLFEILLQRQDGEVREIRGRYLRIAVQMQGDGRHSPAIRTMRVYYPRLSWQQAYLPQHFHQQQRPDPAQHNVPGNGADLRERILACAEGLMTPIEEKVAAAEYWAYPNACPSDHLPKLAGVIGTELPAHWPEYRQRRWLSCYGLLTLRRGTLAGLCLALDIATDGGVARGQVVPVENYRLRRTMATILGLEFDDADHPLTLGTGQSGNSRVGDTLILSEDDAHEFLALFAPGLVRSKDEKKTVDDFFDNYAYQLSVVLHGAARAQRHSVERLLEREAPAHLQWKLIETDHPFVLGLSPLLGIDSYLEQQPPWRAVVLDDTHLTREGIVRNPVALSPAHADSQSDSSRGEP